MLTTRILLACGRCFVAISLVGLLAVTIEAAESYTENPGTEGNGSHKVGPEYKIDPDLTDKGNAKGKQFEFTMALAESKIFRGDDATLEPEKKAVRKERKIFVYVPAAYQDGTRAPLLVIHDGPGQLNLVRNALDNLTISKDPNRKLPAFIAIAIENGGNDGKNSERGLEYDTMSDRLARFVHEEVLPAVVNNKEIKAAYPKLAFTDNPWGRAVMGCSSGGAAALSMGWFRPDLFRRLIAYSGTFVDQQDDDAAEEAKYPLGAWEYHSSMKLIEKSEKKPLRIFTHVSENDLRAKDAEETYHNWVMAGERTEAALAAKGYNHRYVFSLATRHCDGRVFEQTLADTLAWIWRGYHGRIVSRSPQNLMQRVTGIGGVFFRAKDPAALGQWYKDHLGIDLVPTDYGHKSWSQEAGPTVFAPFPHDTDYFGHADKQWMINFRVRDLDAMVEQLRMAKILVSVDKETYPNGRFARLHDPEGNPIELWEPK